MQTNLLGTALAVWPLILLAVGTVVWSVVDIARDGRRGRSR